MLTTNHPYWLYSSEVLFRSIPSPVEYSALTSTWQPVLLTKLYPTYQVRYIAYSPPTMSSRPGDYGGTPFFYLPGLVLAVCKQGSVSPTVVVIHMHGQASWLYSYCRYLSIQLTLDMSGVHTLGRVALVLLLGLSYVRANPLETSGRF